MIYSSPLLLKPMTKHFSLGKEAISTFPVWVQLRNVPLTLWNPIIFGMICLRLGRPIHMDRLTTSKERITYARCLVEVDMAKDLVYSVMLNLDDGGEYEQKVYYENLPRYCPQCKKVGHTKENCKAKQAGNKDNGGKTDATDSGKQPTTSDAREDTRGEWVIKQNIAISASEEPVGCSVEKETAIQELTHNPGSTPVILESVPILLQPPPEPVHSQESYPIPDNQMTEHSLAHPQESIPEIPSSTQLGEGSSIEQANQSATKEKINKPQQASKTQKITSGIPFPTHLGEENKSQQAANTQKITSSSRTIKKGIIRIAGMPGSATKDPSKASSSAIIPIAKGWDRGKKKEKSSQTKNGWSVTLAEFCATWGITPLRPTINDHLLLEYQRFKHASEANWGIEASKEE
ncbi:protein of unknown function DUF4283 protein [Actinidia chinensis var. chinensis]|uniref:Uncharacterized protein n=1 Tax=Actinidia chinensis var. chinensis TaxID=1590841 RepID=A0A2R6PJT5_ACTCC|nr:protein of unknown function DUF4283 protein [Actinidia chinensis var. chinensis]